MRSTEQGHRPAGPAESPRGPARVVVLSQWRAAHRAPEPPSQEARRSLWLVIVAALVVFGPPALQSLARHRVGPAEAAAAANEITFGD